MNIKEKEYEFIKSYFQAHFNKQVNISKFIDIRNIYYRINYFGKLYASRKDVVYPCGVLIFDDEFLGLVKLLSIHSNGIRGVYDMKDEHFYTIIKNFLTTYRMYLFCEVLGVYICKDNVKIIYQYLS